jgi:hypothetical protein
VADFDLGNPFGGEDLVSCEATCRDWVQDGINNVSTLTLLLVSSELKNDEELALTLRNTSMGR